MGFEGRRFAVAPMSLLFIVLSGFVLAIPVVFLLIGLSTDSPVRFTLLAAGALVLLAALGVWFFFKPKEIWLDSKALRLVFPLRQIVLERSEIEGAEVIQGKDLGFAVRVGVGGLFGVFGLVQSSRIGRVNIYATNTHEWLLLRSRGTRPLILSPAEPAQLAQILTSGARPAAASASPGPAPLAAGR